MLEGVSRTWNLRFSHLALRNLRVREKTSQYTILTCLHRRLETATDPRSLGEPLSDNLKSLWRFRVGSYRILCDIREKDHYIVVLRIISEGESRQHLHLVRSSA